MSVKVSASGSESCQSESDNSNSKCFLCLSGTITNSTTRKPVHQIQESFCHFLHLNANDDNIGFFKLVNYCDKCECFLDNIDMMQKQYNALHKHLQESKELIRQIILQNFDTHAFESQVQGKCSTNSVPQDKHSKVNLTVADAEFEGYENYLEYQYHHYQNENMAIMGSNLEEFSIPTFDLSSLSWSSHHDTNINVTPITISSTSNITNGDGVRKKRKKSKDHRRKKSKEIKIFPIFTVGDVDNKNKPKRSSKPTKNKINHDPNINFQSNINYEPFDVPFPIEPGDPFFVSKSSGGSNSIPVYLNHEFEGEMHSEESMEVTPDIKCILGASRSENDLLYEKDPFSGLRVYK